MPPIAATAFTDRPGPTGPAITRSIFSSHLSHVASYNFTWEMSIKPPNSPSSPMNAAFPPPPPPPAAPAGAVEGEGADGVLGIDGLRPANARALIPPIANLELDGVFVLASNLTSSSAITVVSGVSNVFPSMVIPASGKPLNTSFDASKSA